MESGTLLAFIAFSLQRPDTWVSIVGGLITVLGVWTQQAEVFRLQRRAQEVAEESAKKAREYDRYLAEMAIAHNQVKLDNVEWVLLMVANKLGVLSLSAGNHNSVATAISRMAHYAYEFGPRETYVAGVYEKLELANAGDLNAMTWLADEFRKTNEKAAARGVKFPVELFELDRKKAAIDTQINRRNIRSVLLAISGFLLVLLGGLVGSQLSDFSPGGRSGSAAIESAPQPAAQ